MGFCAGLEEVLASDLYCRGRSFVVVLMPDPKLTPPDSLHDLNYWADMLAIFVFGLAPGFGEQLAATWFLDHDRLQLSDANGAVVVEGSKHKDDKDIRECMAGPSQQRLVAVVRVCANP